jgi:hypothetical protein
MARGRSPNSSGYRFTRSIARILRVPAPAARRTVARVSPLSAVQKKQKAPLAVLCRIRFGGARSCGGHTSRVADRNFGEAGLARTPLQQTRTVCIQRSDSDIGLETFGVPCEILATFLPRQRRAWPVRIPRGEIRQTHRSSATVLLRARAAARDDDAIGATARDGVEIPAQWLTTRKLPLADFWQNVGYWIGIAKSSSHHLSQTEIAGDNPCYRHLSEKVSPCSDIERVTSQWSVNCTELDFADAQLGISALLLEGFSAHASSRARRHTTHSRKGKQSRESIRTDLTVFLSSRTRQEAFHPG